MLLCTNSISFLKLSRGCCGQAENENLPRSSLSEATGDGSSVKHAAFTSELKRGWSRCSTVLHSLSEYKISTNSFYFTAKKLYMFSLGKFWVSWKSQINFHGKNLKWRNRLFQTSSTWNEIFALQSYSKCSNFLLVQYLVINTCLLGGLVILLCFGFLTCIMEICPVKKHFPICNDTFC